MNNDTTDTTPSSVPETGTHATSAEVTGSDHLNLISNDGPPAAPKPNRSERRKMADQQKRMGKMIKKMQADQQKRYSKFWKKIDGIKNILGKDEFEALSAICTVQVPEKKDAKDNLVQTARSFVNWQALVTEFGNLMVLRRESRIKLGERKRSTGRSSRRKSHRNSVRNIKARAEKVLQNNEPHSKVEV